MSADVDVAMAWVKKWNATEALAGAIPGGIAEGRRTRPGNSPYATLAVEFGRVERVSGGECWDVRKVTVTVYGVGLAAVGGVVASVKAAFDSAPDADWQLPFAAVEADDVIAHLRTEPVSDIVGLDDAAKEGDDVRKAALVWNVHTHRRKG